MSYVKGRIRYEDGISALLYPAYHMDGDVTESALGVVAQSKAWWVDGL